MSRKPRNIPEWMKGRGKAVGSALNNIVSDPKKKTAKKRENLFSDLEDVQRREKVKSKPVSYDDLDDTEPQDRFSEFPMVKYDGKIKYLREFYDVAETFDSLLTQIQKSDSAVPVSFDLEWTFDYKTGPHPTAVLQVCCDLDQCYIVQMSDLSKKIPVSFSAFLNHPNSILHGVNIKNDLRKLARDFPCFNGDKLIEKCLDLGEFYNSVFNSQERWSLDRLTAQTLKARVDKSRHLRMSNWNRTPLSETQLMYAAIDVYVSNKFFKIQ